MAKGPRDEIDKIIHEGVVLEHTKGPRYYAQEMARRYEQGRMSREGKPEWMMDHQEGEEANG